MEPTPPEPQTALGDQIYLGDLLRIVLRSWRLIGVCLAVAVGLAAWYVSAVPRQFEARMLVRPAYQLVLLGGPEPGSPAVTFAEIEPREITVERMNQPAFQAAVLRGLGWNGDSREQLFRASFGAVSRGANVEISVRGLSPDDARAGVTAALETLSAAHGDLIHAVDSLRTKKLNEIASAIARIHSGQARLKNVGDNLQRQNHREVTDWLRLVVDIETQLYALRTEEHTLREALREGRTVPTQATGAASVSENPVHPRLKHVGVIAILGGLLLGLFLAVLRALGRQRHRVQ